MRRIQPEDHSECSPYPPDEAWAGQHRAYESQDGSFLGNQNLQKSHISYSYHSVGVVLESEEISL